MLSAAKTEHGLALALGGRCPLCAEVDARAGVLARDLCGHCGGALGDDAWLDDLVARARERSRSRLARVLLWLAVAGLLLGFVPLLGALAVAVGLAFHQVAIVAPALALLARPRRLVTRWTLRLLTATVGVVSGSLITLASFSGLGGFAAAIGAPLSVASVWLGSGAYLSWQLSRERAREPVAAPERWLLGLSALLVVGSAVVVGAVVLLLARGLGRLLAWVLPLLG